VLVPIDSSLVAFFLTKNSTFHDNIVPTVQLLMLTTQLVIVQVYGTLILIFSQVANIQFQKYVVTPDAGE